MQSVSQGGLLRAFILTWVVGLPLGAPAPAAGPPKPGAPATAVERHSPSDGYPSLGPPAAKNTLVFFTDYQ